MEKQLINNYVSEKDLRLIFESIEELNSKLNEVGLEIFKNETDINLLSKSSHFTFSIIHRAIELNRGFKSLSESNNWITTINLIRLQADNCMR
jgi:ABC-type enterochelin transport system substrate-binding protein